MVLPQWGLPRYSSLALNPSKELAHGGGAYSMSEVLLMAAMLPAAAVMPAAAAVTPRLPLTALLS